MSQTAQDNAHSQDNPHSKYFIYTTTETLERLNVLLDKVLSHKLFDSGVIKEGETLRLAVKSSTGERISYVTPEGVKQLETALYNYEDLRGSVAIFAGTAQVLVVEDGKIVVDPYKLIDPIEKLLREIEQSWPDKEQGLPRGRDLLKYVFVMLTTMGEKQSDGWLTYEDQGYKFMEKEGQISVISKHAKGEILNNGGFTKLADQLDMHFIESIGKITQQYCSRQSPHRPSFKP